jgi:hypothetical protein
MDKIGMKKKLLQELMGKMEDDEVMKHPNAPAMLISIGISPKKMRGGEESDEMDDDMNSTQKDVFSGMGGNSEMDDEEMEQDELDPRLKDIIRRKLNLRK